MGPRGLAGMARDTLRGSWAEMRMAFSLFARPESWPLLVHCTQGKDRTGLLVLLLCRLVGVPVEACERDYRLSQGELESGRDERLEESRRYGLPEAFVDCEEGWVESVVQYVDREWGGVEQYLLWCGVTEDQNNERRQAF
ncbi:hypothetical protein ANO11243_026910 [Dothideomycetidae sp. 11243]|nr:hypothetical protein ANO11243_026910 [fungal sp. No.11243]